MGYSQSVSQSPAVLKKDNGSEKVGFKKNETGAISRTVNDKLNEIVTAADYGALTTNTAAQNSAAIQLAIDANSTGGGIIVPKGCEFNFYDLDLSANEFDLFYCAKDEVDRDEGSPPGTNETVHFSNNWKQDGGGTTDVNERRFESPHHSGFVLNTRGELPKQGTAPYNSKASIIYMENGYNQYQEGQNVYNDSIKYFALQTWEVRHTLNLGSSHFPVLPVVGQMVEGDTSGSRGIILAITAGTMLVSWVFGKWESGETVTVNATNQSTSALPSKPSFVYNNKPFRFVMSTSGGNGFNTTPDRATTSLHVGGTFSMETAQGGGLGSAAPRFTMVDDIVTPTQGFMLDIDPTNNGLRLLDYNGAEQGVMVSGDFPSSVVVADAQSGGNTVTPSQTTFYKKGIDGVVWFKIALINVNTSGLTSGNQIFIRNLPSTVLNYASARSQVNVSVSQVTSSNGHISGECISNTNVVALFDNTTTGRSNLNVSAISSGNGDLFISGFYIEA